eukprot:5671318-Pyramimonas_sp.AAC.1
MWKRRNTARAFCAGRWRVAVRVGLLQVRPLPPWRQPLAWPGPRRPCAPRGPTRRRGLPPPWGG